MDSGFRELIRERFASLFKKDIKSEVIEQSSARKMKDEKAQGIFGGDKRMRSVLSNATKSSSILKNAVVPKRVPRKECEDDSSPEGRARARSRSPDKAKRGQKRFGGGSSRKSSRNGKKSGNGSKSGGKSSRESDSNKPRSISSN